MYPGQPYLADFKLHISGEQTVFNWSFVSFTVGIHQHFYTNVSKPRMCTCCLKCMLTYLFKE